MNNQLLFFDILLNSKTYSILYNSRLDFVNYTEEIELEGERLLYLLKDELLGRESEKNNYSLIKIYLGRLNKYKYLCEKILISKLKSSILYYKNPFNEVALFNYSEILTQIIKILKEIGFDLINIGQIDNQLYDEYCYSIFGNYSIPYIGKYRYNLFYEMVHVYGIKKAFPTGNNQSVIQKSIDIDGVGIDFEINENDIREANKIYIQYLKEDKLDSLNQKLHEGFYNFEEDQPFNYYTFQELIDDILNKYGFDPILHDAIKEKVKNNIGKEEIENFLIETNHSYEDIELYFLGKLTLEIAILNDKDKLKYIENFTKRIQKLSQAVDHKEINFRSRNVNTSNLHETLITFLEEEKLLVLSRNKNLFESIIEKRYPEKKSNPQQDDANSLEKIRFQGSFKSFSIFIKALVESGIVKKEKELKKISRVAQRTFTTEDKPTFSRDYLYNNMTAEYSDKDISEVKTMVANMLSELEKMKIN